MTHYIRIVLLLALAATHSATAAEAPAKSPVPGTIPGPASVLFVGNSFTYYNNGLQNQLIALMKSGGVETGRQRILTLSGARLREHLASLPALVAANHWDVVVLQSHSREAFDPDQLQDFRDAAADLDAVARSGGAATILFMTWAYSGAPEETDVIARNYATLGNELGALVVPVGLAFADVTERFPGIALRIADRRHPTPAGTYLAACTFYAAFVGKSPQGLDFRAGLEPGVADKLQSAAWRAVQSYRGGN